MRWAGFVARKGERRGVYKILVGKPEGKVCVVRRTSSQLHSLQQIPTQHDMLPQHLVYKNELNREYVITLARNDETP